MFFKKLSCDNFTNLIAAHSHITGTVIYNGVLKIQGTIEGDIIKPLESDSNDDEWTIIVDKYATVRSNEICCDNAIIKGMVSSKKLWVANALRIDATANIIGTEIYFRSLEVCAGALLKDCKMHHIDYMDHA